MSISNYSGYVIDERYKILSLIDEGGMGTVYLGYHIRLQKKVAVKILHTDFADKERMTERFYREAQIVANIGHRNIADVIDVGVSFRGDVYMVMELLEGDSLERFLRYTGPISLAAACGIMEPILLALEAIHEMGIVHRDLKPANVFVVCKHHGDRPEVKLIDFGISKFLGSNLATLTNRGELLGTPSYMSPEQILEDREIDQRTDIYSAGMIMYKMLSGRLPFADIKSIEQLAVSLNREPIPGRQAHADFPLEAEPLIMHALQKEPLERPQSAREMLNALRKMTGFHERQKSFAGYTTAFAEHLMQIAPKESESTGKREEELFRLETQMRKMEEGKSAPDARKPKLRAAQGNKLIRRKTVGITIVVLILIVMGFYLFAKEYYPTTQETMEPAVAPPSGADVDGPISSLEGPFHKSPGESASSQTKDELTRLLDAASPVTAPLPQKKSPPSKSIPKDNQSSETNDRGPFGNGVRLDFSDIINERYLNPAKDK